MKKKIVAIVPMRDRSERVPGKNYRLFAGKPLFHYIISSLLQCREISRVVIDTDSETIMKDTSKSFPDVEIIERPEHLRDGSIPMNDVLLNDMQHIKADFYLQTHSTNPLLSHESISQAIKKYQEQFPTYDSLFTVTRIQTRLWDQLARPVNHNPAILLRTQDLPPIYAENSCMYLFTREILESRHNRVGERPLMYELKPEEAWDIDEESDFRIAELLYKLQGAGS
ncbi:acylneuraminate cytidylyltransferase family protein [uncultured Methanoregula sp.]|uniref:acylneuraminate cytidylyltransferase family protein n=1 Tax=uncultured Methanoregula sp. TaxID=1005933 RepID=UPI002AAB5E0C|nr:acylneuraminate cytidylyltransferase family protein [uncultured Methanoregula sp.]